MSIIRLTTYVVAQKEANALEILYGKNLNTKDEDGRLVVEAPNAVLPIGKSAPGGETFVALYGFRDALQEISRRKAEVIAIDPRKMIFHPVSLDFEVGDINPKIMSKSEIGDANFVNFARTSAEVQRMVLDYFQGYVVDEGGSSDQMNRVAQIGDRPDLWGRLLEEKEFKHIGIIVAPVAMERTKFSQFAFCSPRARLDRIEQNCMNGLNCVAPEWMMRNRTAKPKIAA